MASRERTHSGRFTDLEAYKLRGGYYTSPEVAAWLSSWAIRSTDDRILEPSYGDGAFLEAAAARLKVLGLNGSVDANQILGLELLRVEAAKARRRLKSLCGLRANNMVRTGDFFAWWDRTARPQFDAVIGNPPFIRYQSFPEPCRSRAMEIMKRLRLARQRKLFVEAKKPSVRIETDSAARRTC